MITASELCTLQWNLSNTDTIGTKIFVYINLGLSQVPDEARCPFIRGVRFHCITWYVCNVMLYIVSFLLQVSVHIWFRTALLVLLLVHNGASQSCSTPFEAVIASVTDQVVPASSFQFADPEMRFYTEILRFTTEEINQEMENAIQYFTTEFGVNFSNIEPNDANQRFLPTAVFGPVQVPFNSTIIANRWILTGNRRSRCFTMSVGYFGVTFNDTTMLHGVYGGEQGLPVNAGELLAYGYLVIFGACAQQPILIQTRSNTPTRILPVEGWSVEDLRLYNRQLGDGRFQGVFKIRPSPDDSTMVVLENQLILSFP